MQPGGQQVDNVAFCPNSLPLLSVLTVHYKRQCTFYNTCSQDKASNSRLDIGVTPSVNSAINSFTY